MTPEEQKSMCESCEHSLIVSAGKIKFLGCYFLPYKGKWTAEIKECPKQKAREE